MIYFKLLIAVVVQYWCYLTSLLHLTLLIIKTFKNTWCICGVKGDPLKWFLSYLKGRVQSVQIGSTFSREQSLLFGLAQGSVLGPVLIKIYTAPLGRIIQRHGLTYRLYADDTQLGMAFKPSDLTFECDCISRIEACVAEKRIWMDYNFLKLMNFWSLQPAKGSVKYQVYRSSSVISRSLQVMIHQET